ncbi:Elongation factor 1-alpha [Psidium guajava]|nr:Elongation factor 1-alpha [Psidium guajava]
MIAAEFVRAPPTEELVVSDSLQVPNNYDDDDGDDALSLCNLSLYSDAAHYSFADDVASPSSSSSSSSSSLDHDDVFEFSSFGDSDSSSHLRSDDRSIVFCGKRIPLRESPPNAPTSTASPEDKRSPLRTGCGSRKSTSRRTRSPTVRRRKCRWYRMAFGLARFPTEMALSEMRTRQSRNAMKSGSCDGSGGGEIVRSGDESKGKGFFGLLKALGLGHRRRADALVKASFGCVPRV